MSKVSLVDNGFLLTESPHSPKHVAGLLDQERPNIFTQSVGNIGPGQEVNIEIWHIRHARHGVVAKPAASPRE